MLFLIQRRRVLNQSHFCQLFIRMTQLAINIKDKSILPHLKKILNAIEGVSIVKTTKKKKCGLEEALDDVKAGKVHLAENVDDMFQQILGI